MKLRLFSPDKSESGITNIKIDYMSELLNKKVEIHGMEFRVIQWEVDNPHPGGSPMGKAATYMRTEFRI